MLHTRYRQANSQQHSSIYHTGSGALESISIHTIAVGSIIAIMLCTITIACGLGAIINKNKKDAQEGAPIKATTYGKIIPDHTLLARERELKGNMVGYINKLKVQRQMQCNNAQESFAAAEEQIKWMEHQVLQYPLEARKIIITEDAAAQAEYNQYSERMQEKHGIMDPTSPA